jgi:HKD family nuclease/transposase-like protein
MKLDIVLQPSNAIMGEIIKDLLSSENPFYDKVWLVSAFANAKAVQRIAPNILEAKIRGVNINIVVGFDVKSTSAEALKLVDSLEVNSILVHNARGGHTFHPKIYLFEATGLRADLFIGSNNLTDGGLYTNYEASTRIIYEFPSDYEQYSQFFTSLDVYLNPKGSTAQILTDDLIEILVERGDLATEKEIRKFQHVTLRSNDKTGIPKSPFGIEKIRRPPVLNKSAKKSTIAIIEEKTSVLMPLEPLSVLDLRFKTVIDQFDTLQDAILYFSNLQNAVDFVADLRWADGVACPYCGSKDPYFIRTRKTWRCKICKKDFSAKVGTIFEDSPISLDKWLITIWMVANAKNKISSFGLHRFFGITQKSTWFMLHRIQLAMQAEENKINKNEHKTEFERFRDLAKLIVNVPKKKLQELEKNIEKRRRHYE